MAHAKLSHEQLELQVYTENKQAIAFYRKQGFTVEREQTDEHTGHREFVMVYSRGAITQKWHFISPGEKYQSKYLLLHPQIFNLSLIHIFMRLVLSGYENREIAQIMDSSVNSIKTLKYGAIRKLREYFNSGDYEIG